jgi:hypothetical protein
MQEFAQRLQCAIANGADEVARGEVPLQENFVFYGKSLARLSLGGP